MSKPPIAAIIYDFDKTLSTREMQEYSFVEKTGMSPREFWDKCNRMMYDHSMDQILAYMYVMADESKKKNLGITRENFNLQGREVELLEGVDTWFDRVTEYGRQHGVQVEHYVISSGLKEIIEGTPIAHYFKMIYAAEFYYDEKGEPIWPAMAVNYTSKTQFVYRINKGVLDVTDHNRLNESTLDDEKRVPFANMVYIGDGMTDVPCMKLVKLNGGHSIAVYQNNDEVARYLLYKGRVNFISRADYSAGKRLEKLIFALIDKIKAESAIFAFKEPFDGD